LPGPMPRLLLPMDTLCGAGSIVALRGVACSQALILSGRNLSNELLATIQNNLSAENVLHLVRQSKEPTLGTIHDLLVKLDGFTPDCIVAVGGGSTIDTAKLVLMYLEVPEIDPERIKKPFAIPPLKKRTKLVAIPTNAGSGAEASSAAVYTDADTGGKVPVVTHDFIPDVSILDSRFLQGIPKTIMAASIIDALTHAIEAYISLVSNPLAESLAEKAVQMIGTSGPAYFKDTSDTETILQLQIAAYFAGIAQNHCGVGSCHSLAHQMNRYGIGHGIANSLFLESVLEFNQGDPSVKARLERLTHAANVESINELAKEIRSLGDLPSGIAQITPRPEIDMELVAEGALVDICTRFNPRKMARDDFIRLVEVL